MDVLGGGQSTPSPQNLPLCRGQNVGLGSPSPPHTSPALPHETQQFKTSPNFVSSPGSGVLQMNKESATALLPFITNSSFLNGVFKAFLSYLKKDQRCLSPCPFRVPPLKLPNKAKCQCQLSALTNSEPQPVSFASPAPDTHYGEPQEEPGVISSRWEEKLHSHISQPCPKSPLQQPHAPARREERQVHLEFKAPQVSKGIIIISWGTRELQAEHSFQGKLKVFTRLHSGLAKCLLLCFKMHKQG